jgi:hypothetical protein
MIILRAVAGAAVVLWLIGAAATIIENTRKAAAAHEAVTQRVTEEP